MLKFGIFGKKQLTPDRLEGFVNSRKFIALDLYDRLDDLPEAQIDKIQERMLRWFRSHNGVLKCTYGHRFDDFDRISLSIIADSFSADEHIHVHDIGVSDGRTACSFYRDLSALFGKRLKFLASDYDPYVYVLKRSKSVNRLIIDDELNVLQIITPPFVFNIGRLESIIPYPINFLARQFVTAVFVLPLLADYRAGRDTQRTPVELLCSECRMHLGKDEGFGFDSYDVLSRSNGRFHVIRVMNLLNYSYFPEAQLRIALENIAGSLREGGLFITGSNMERGTVVHGGIYKVTDLRLGRVAISGTGSPVDRLIRSLGRVAGDSC